MVPLLIILSGAISPASSLVSFSSSARDVLHVPVRSSSLSLSLAAVPPASNVDLVRYLDPSFSEDAELLSPNRIVEMMISPSSTSEVEASNSRPLRQELFSSPLVSVLYERALPPLWAAGLRIGGPDSEYASAAPYLGGDGTGVALDLSCGTGFVARRMAKSGKFLHVFALDYSSQMLGECLSTIEREREGAGLALSLIRGDAGRLPFRDGVLDAVHWGAAMHCVPDAEQALSEVYRILKPGGRLYATTFLRPFPDIVFRFFELEEIEELARGAGFDRGGGGTLEVERRGVYGILRATKK